MPVGNTYQGIYTYPMYDDQDMVWIYHLLICISDGYYVASNSSINDFNKISRFVRLIGAMPSLSKRIAEAWGKNSQCALSYHSRSL